MREWTRIANELTGERTRLVHRLRQQLWRYYPQFLSVENDLTKTWVPDLWKLAPTPVKARRLGPATIAAFLKSRRVRVVSAQDVLKHLRETPITVASGTAEAAVAHIRVIISSRTMRQRPLGGWFGCWGRDGPLRVPFQHLGDPRWPTGRHEGRRQAA